MMRTYFLLILPVLLLGQINAQDQIVLPEGLGISNHLEYGYDIDLEQITLENWLNLDYRKGVFVGGLRLDIFQPNDPNPAISRGKERYADIAFKYVELDLGDAEEGMKITAGNYYSLFGRGMILKSYENRNIRIDNNLLGAKVEGYYAGFRLIALSGMAENANAERKDILQAVDLEFRGLRFLKLGGSFASNKPEEGVARTRMASVRIQPGIWNFDLYGEYGVKYNDDTKKIFMRDTSIVGFAYYTGANFYYGPFSIVGEYKHYDNFVFESEDKTIVYNTPPAVRKEYTYTLLNRHPSPLNQASERGFQVEGNYNLSDETFFSAAYGVTKSLGSDSYYQRINNFNIPSRIQLKEVFLQATHSWSDNFKTIGVFGYNEELDANTKNITPILESQYYLDDINTLRLIIEHQHTTDRSTTEQYYTDIVLLEYLRSPKLSIAVVSEMQTKENESGKIVRKFWNFIQFGYKLWNHTDISLLIGSRQAGNICIGGVCRYEPDFRGVEVKMFTRL
jgi:hypothetical protein